jgi:hypothetical protein
MKGTSMNKLLAVLLLCLPRLALAAGSVSFSTQPINQGNTAYIVTINWTGDASTGSVPTTTINGLGPVQGYQITQIQTVPGTPAPTAGYSITVKDVNGYDMAGGQATTLSATASASFATTSATPPIVGSLSFALTGNSVASAKGKVILYIFKPSVLAAANLLGRYGSGGSTGDVVGPASSTTDCFSKFADTTGKLLADSTLCEDSSKNGGISFLGSVSGELGLTVANVAGTAVTIVLPADTSTATTGYVLALGGTTTCPTALPAGFPSTCRSSSWAASGGGTTVSAASPYITISGTNYLPFGMYTVTTPPASSWTALNSQTSSTGSQGEITMTTAGTSNANFYGFYRTITSNTLEAAIMCTSGAGSSTVRAGVGVRGSGGDMVIVGPNVNANVSPGFGIAKWTNATTYSGGYETGLTGSGVYYIKVVNNGSTITPYGSFDGKFWMQIYDGGGSVNNVTGTGWAWGTQGSGNSVLNGYCELLSWKEY